MREFGLTIGYAAMTAAAIGLSAWSSTHCQA